MTSIKMLGLLGLLLGFALVLTAGASGEGCAPRGHGETLCVFDRKDALGHVVRDGDRFMAVRLLTGDGIQRPRNFTKSRDMLYVDHRYLGYDLRGKNKNVLVRELPNRKISARDLQDMEWEFVWGEKGTPFRGHFRVKNGELTGWWIGLGRVEPAKKGEPVPRNRRGERAPLILVKDKKDAAGFDWSDDPPDDGR